MNEYLIVLNNHGVPTPCHVSATPMETTPPTHVLVSGDYIEVDERTHTLHVKDSTGSTQACVCIGTPVIRTSDSGKFASEFREVRK